MDYLYKVDFHLFSGGHQIEYFNQADYNRLVSVSALDDEHPCFWQFMGGRWTAEVVLCIH